MKILRLALILFYNPGICYLLTSREGQLCHLMQSCHKNIQDALAFNLAVGKMEQSLSCATKLLLPDAHGIRTRILHAVDLLILCPCLICEFLCSLLLIFSPSVASVLTRQLKEKRESSVNLLLFSNKILQKEYFLTGFKPVTTF